MTQKPLKNPCKEVRVGPPEGDLFRMPTEKQVSQLLKRGWVLRDNQHSGLAGLPHSLMPPAGFPIPQEGYWEHFMEYQGRQIGVPPFWEMGLQYEQ